MLTLRLAITVASVAVSVLHASHATAQCTKDIECKHDRVCEDGRCVDPEAAPPAAGAAVRGGCTSDAQCKLGRVCQNGACVRPAASGVAAPPVAPPAPLVAPPPQPAAPPPQPVAPAPQPLPVLTPSQGTQTTTMNDLELQDLQSRRKIGRSLLITGIVAFVVGGAAQAGWALEECWATGTNISGYNYDCELTTLGSSLVITGFVLLALGTTGIIIGAVQLKKAKTGMRQLSTASLSVSPFVDPRNRSQGLALQLSF